LASKPLIEIIKGPDPLKWISSSWW